MPALTPFLRPALAALLSVGCMAPAAKAFTPTFASPAVVTATRAEVLGSYALPVGPWNAGGLPTRITEGPLVQTAWRLETPGQTTLQLLAPLRAQLEAEGYAPVFECDTTECGGFDFRYATDVLPEPDMHVDLGDFRFLSATRNGPDGEEAVGLLVSRTSASGFVQVVHVGGPPAPPTTIASSGTASPPQAGRPQPLSPAPAASGTVPDDLEAGLEAGGAVALDDLVFETGSATLGPGDFASLDALAAYLRSHPAARVTLVGHTDASGGLAGNTALSKARAASVRERLIAGYSIPATQIAAEGAGYLAPRASNLTEEGRARNRRVEVMLMTSTQ